MTTAALLGLFVAPPLLMPPLAVHILSLCQMMKIHHVITSFCAYYNGLLQFDGKQRSITEKRPLHFLLTLVLIIGAPKPCFCRSPCKFDERFLDGEPDRWARFDGDVDAVLTCALDTVDECPETTRSQLPYCVLCFAACCCSRTVPCSRCSLACRKSVKVVVHAMHSVTCLPHGNCRTAQ